MKTFSSLLPIGAGNSPVTGEFPPQRPVTRSFDIFFDIRLNKRLSKQSWGWWFETPSRPVWRQCNGDHHHHYQLHHSVIINVTYTSVVMLTAICDGLSWMAFTMGVIPTHSGLSSSMAIRVPRLAVAGNISESTHNSSTVLARHLLMRIPKVRGHPYSWWRHQIETFSPLLALCAGNPPVTGEFPPQRPVILSFMFSLISAWKNGDAIVLIMTSL